MESFRLSWVLVDVYRCSEAVDYQTSVKQIYRTYPICTNGLVHHYHLFESSFIFEGPRVIILFI